MGFSSLLHGGWKMVRKALTSLKNTLDKALDWAVQGGKVLA
ncbi:MAG: hypothetical protein NTY86_12960 [Deltaproteobacteria bacterium]|nr:hypothetical protein [Deltaproteobacteria bacterium]